MTRTVVGLFDTAHDAEYVVRLLKEQGFNAKDISLITHESRNEELATAEGASAGAVSGTVLGGMLGLLVGAGLITIPGVGPALAAGPIATAIGSTALGAGVGATAGGLVGALVGAGVPEEEANYYAEGVRRGSTLVSVTADEPMADGAYDLMHRHGAVDIQQRSAGWREEGWTEFNPYSLPYEEEDVRAYLRHEGVLTDDRPNYLRDRRGFM